MEMPKQIFFSMLIEAALVTLTVLLLVQPFRKKQNEVKTPFVGMILLCLTFCWSIVFGCVLALNEITFRL